MCPILLALGNAQAAQHRVFNIGSGIATHLGDVIALIAAELGMAPRLIYLPEQAGDVPHTCADFTAAELALGYAPRVTLQAGIQRYCSALRSAAFSHQAQELAAHV